MPSYMMDANNNQEDTTNYTATISLPEETDYPVEYYRWQCWHDRPRNGYEFIYYRSKAMWDNTKIGTILFFPVASILYTGMLALYYATLPFALVNEWVRE